jgi:uncharacterized RDD family membrane protein YckC
MPTRTDTDIIEHEGNGAAAHRYSGVLTRRVAAFLIDAVILALLITLAALVVGVVGLVTFGLGWLLYAVLVPLIVLPYVAFTLGGPEQATPGMRLAGVRIISDDGARVDPLMAAGHHILFWAFSTLLTPLVLALALFTRRKRTLHDILLRTAVIRA